MINEESSPELVQLARALGVVSNDPFQGTVATCLAMVESWVEQSGGIGPSGISNAAEFQRLLTHRLALAIEEIHSEEDFDRLTDFYARQRGEYVFAGLRARFDNEDCDGDEATFGVLIRRRNALPEDTDKFVAVVDCRGEKHARRYFTRWHEIAHRMTTHSDCVDDGEEYQGELIEVLMDAIASELGFFEPFLQTAVHNVFGSENWLTFEMIERIIDDVFPEASFQSTLFACMRSSPMPMVYVELDGHPLAFKKIIPNKAAQADGLLYRSRTKHTQDLEQNTPAKPHVTQLALGALPAEGSVFHRVSQRPLLSEEIEHLSMDLLAMRQGMQMNSTESGSEARKRLHEILTHAQARHVPGKIIGLLQY